MTDDRMEIYAAEIKRIKSGPNPGLHIVTYIDEDGRYGSVSPQFPGFSTSSMNVDDMYFDLCEWLRNNPDVKKRDMKTVSQQNLAFSKI